MEHSNKPPVYNVRSQFSNEEVHEAADKMIEEASVIGRNTVTKLCLTIVVCSVIKTAGRVLIARNYAKKL